MDDENKVIMGRHINLDNGGKVWLSIDPVKDQNERDAWVIIFTNPEGKETDITLTEEAIRALTALYYRRTGAAA